MDDFKKSTKMQCYREGGSVAYKSRHSEKSEMKDDMSQDKKVVKKAVKMHDDQLHEGKNTNLTKLKHGGRAKKSVGTVKKYDKASGEYGAKKGPADIKRIEEAKNFKPKKLQMGGQPGPAMAPSGAMSGTDAKLKMMEKKRQMEKMKRARMLDPAQQGELISQDPAAAGLPSVGKPLMRKGGDVKKMMNGGTC